MGIDFQTPEEFFLHEAPHPFIRDFEPSIYLNLADSTSLDASPFVIDKKNALDIVLFCGSPGSGKSTFYRKHLQPLSYERINQDTLKTVRLLFPTRLTFRVVSMTADLCSSEGQMPESGISLFDRGNLGGHRSACRR